MLTLFGFGLLAPQGGHSASRKLQSRVPVEAPLLLEEAIHIQMTPAEERCNRDMGLELPGC